MTDEMVEKARKVADDMFFGPCRPKCDMSEDQIVMVRYGAAVRVICAALEAALGGRDAYQRGIREGMERAARIADRYAEQNREASTKASTRAKKFKRLGDIFGHGEMAESAVWELDACAYEARAIAFAIRESKEEA